MTVWRRCPQTLGPLWRAQLPAHSHHLLAPPCSLCTGLPCRMSYNGKADPTDTTKDEKVRTVLVEFKKFNKEAKKREKLEWNKMYSWWFWPCDITFKYPSHIIWLITFPQLKQWTFSETEEETFVYFAGKFLPRHFCWVTFWSYFSSCFTEKMSTFFINDIVTREVINTPCLTEKRRTGDFLQFHAVFEANT